jgi:very-short-patch-repair endonuclease
MTRSETLLWRYLKAHHLDGLAFRRQVAMDRYIVDFVCHSARLIIEIDGETHDLATRRQADQVRDTWLSSRGYLVLRFSNADVSSNLEGVWQAVRDTANDRTQTTPPSLSLPRKGGGNAGAATRATAPAVSGASFGEGNVGGRIAQ